MEIGEFVIDAKLIFKAVLYEDQSMHGNLQNSKNLLVLKNSLWFYSFGSGWKYSDMKQSGFFNVEERLARLSRLSKQLETFSGLWILKSSVYLGKAMAYSDRRKSDHPQFDPALIFKILVI